MRRSTSVFAALAAVLAAYPAFAGEKTVRLNVDNMYCEHPKITYHRHDL
jgi:hypothetical protein